MTGLFSGTAALSWHLAICSWRLAVGLEAENLSNLQIKIRAHSRNSLDNSDAESG
jgi:hypothetical protein